MRRLLNNRLPAPEGYSTFVDKVFVTCNEPAGGGTDKRIVVLVTTHPMTRPAARAALRAIKSNGLYAVYLNKVKRRLARLPPVAGGSKGAAGGKARAASENNTTAWTPSAISYLNSTVGSICGANFSGGSGFGCTDPQIWVPYLQVSASRSECTFS